MRASAMKTVESRRAALLAPGVTVGPGKARRPRPFTTVGAVVNLLGLTFSRSPLQHRLLERTKRGSRESNLVNVMCSPAEPQDT